MPEHSEEFERPEPAPYDELSEDDVMALQAENERLRAEKALVMDALRIAHMHALQGGYGVEDGNDVEFVMDALSDSSGGEG